MNTEVEQTNKTYLIVKALKENGDLHERFVNGKITMKEISEMYDVSYQHVANLIKEYNIGNLRVDREKAKEREKTFIQHDINNALPIDYIKPRYSMFSNIKSTMSLFNSINGRIANGELEVNLPMITMHKLLNVIILEVNIYKVIKANNEKPKTSRLRNSDIADKFNVSYTKIATISSHMKKSPNNILPNKDDALIKTVIRNLELVNRIKESSLEHEKAIEELANYYNLSEEMIKRIISCEPYAIGSDIEEYIEFYKKEHNK
ncbi:hypothetical protein [Staphylococcus warneri]|uniref:hypothetical protein n=1 Tax=Staphylococcus warneri TaxID=1292 RepID=UPI001A8C4881|nr:hypothetical protein [Staphylococcus warneri]MBO0377043.1 hypothetical protein [Staphylococcus warneri]